MSNENKSTATSLLNTVFSPVDDESTRRAGHHATQVAVDTIAYAFNIPLRLLLLAKLQDLPNTIRSLLADPDILKILKDEAENLSEGDYSKLASEFLNARSWILSLAKEKPDDRPDSLPIGWEQGMLILLPHLERRVWLTQNANPLPAHSLCRMQDQWALFVLMWSSMHADEFGRQEPIQDVMGVNGLVVRPLLEFSFTDSQGEPTLCIPVVGPIFESPRDSQNAHRLFQKVFRDYIANANKQAHDWKSGTLTPPNRDELADALEARMDLSVEESKLRADQARHSLSMLLTATAIPEILPMSRTDCEMVAMLTSWIARWDSHLAKIAVTVGKLSLPTRGSDYSVIAKRDEIDWKLNIARGAPESDINVILGTHETKYNDCHIDRIDSFVNRIRERQNAAWSAQIIAINNLLNRHDASTTTFSEHGKINSEHETRHEPEHRNQAEHLLRGFGGRICRHLVSITRADIADVYWFDYGQTPPRLIHAGGYARMASHRANAENICKDFDEWAWKKGEPESNNTSPATLRDKSPAQAYRVAATGREDPQPISDNTVERKRVVPCGVSIELGEREQVTAYFSGFPEKTRPKDAMASPLLINGRVVGVITLAGLVEQQFDPRLFVPVRRAGSLVATCMYHQSQLYHMGLLNSLFVRQSAFELQRYDTSNNYNPLIEISRYLCNIFLCPVVHLWLRSKGNPNRFELHGYNWPGILNVSATKSAEGNQEFIYKIGKRRDPRNDAFSELAIDLWHKNSGSNHGGFVQGHFFPEVALTTGYDADDASTKGCALGLDFLEVDETSSGYMHYRKRIFKAPPAGHALHDIMSFLLTRPNADTHSEIAGIVTLHDWSNSEREHDEICQPWDKGWSAVVAHMQTYLPYLLTQAEVLNNPLVDARRYLIHAGRAELIAVLDTTLRLRSLLSNSLAPNRGVRNALDEIMRPNFKGDYREKLSGAHIILENAWKAVEDSVSPIWEQNLTQLANIMHDYRSMAVLDVSIAEANEMVGLRQQIHQILDSYERQIRKEGIFTDVEIPGDVMLRMPALWFRMIMGDLIHNAAKYATNGRALEVNWVDQTRTLTLQNEGPYQSDKDIPERLMEQGYRGSAAKYARNMAKPETAANRKGQGLGLWGANVMCGVLGIKFEFDIPKKLNLIDIGNEVMKGRAIYKIKLTFPRGMLEKARPADKDFY